MVDPVTELVNLLSSLDTFVAIVTIISALVPLTLIPIIQYLMRRQTRIRESKEQDKKIKTKEIISQMIKEKHLEENVEKLKDDKVPAILEDIKDIKDSLKIREERFTNMENTLKTMQENITNLNTDLSVLNAVLSETDTNNNNIIGRKKRSLLKK